MKKVKLESGESAAPPTKDELVKKEWVIAFMKSKMWDGAAAIFERDFDAWLNAFTIPPRRK